jgi:hypothetical protein
MHSPPVRGARLLCRRRAVVIVAGAGRLLCLAAIRLHISQLIGRSIIFCRAIRLLGLLGSVVVRGFE